MNDYRTHANGKLTRTYSIYYMMRNRCYSEKAINYPRYGGKGVTVCERWLDKFENFVDDMGNAPDGLTLDRIDNKKGYSPDNCQWINYYEQNVKRSNSLWLTYRGKTYTAKQWAYLINMDYDRLQQRLKKGWSVERSLNTPVRSKSNAR